MPDKFVATWVSHSSINDFLNCPRSYFLKNVYKDPSSGRKIQIITPALALGQAVHQVVESLSTLPVIDRFKVPLIEKFEQVWQAMSGKQGGFGSSSQEKHYFDRGKEMLLRITRNPGPIGRLAVKIKEELPSYWLSDTDEIILCGKIDWLEYLEETNSVHIIDFKTSKREANGGSLQLPIYHLLVANTQDRKVSGLSYWYLELNDQPSPQRLPDLDQARSQVLQIAKKMKTARKLNAFKCPAGAGGCRHCLPFEKIIAGEAELIGTGSYNRDIYILPESETTSMESEIL